MCSDLPGMNLSHTEISFLSYKKKKKKTPCCLLFHVARCCVLFVIIVIMETSGVFKKENVDPLYFGHVYKGTWLFLKWVKKVFTKM